MRQNGLQFLVLVGSLITVTGCSTAWERTTWKAHPTEFRSADRLIFFSAQTAEDSARRRPKPEADDVIRASDEPRRVQPITVSQDQIVER